MTRSPGAAGGAGGSGGVGGIGGTGGNPDAVKHDVLFFFAGPCFGWSFQSQVYVSFHAVLSAPGPLAPPAVDPVDQTCSGFGVFGSGLPGHCGWQGANSIGVPSAHSTFVALMMVQFGALTQYVILFAFSGFIIHNEPPVTP